MTIRFQCPNCAARLATGEEQHAVPVDCPQCHTMLLVPDTTAPGATTTDGLRRAEEAAVNFHSRRKVADAEMDMTPMVDVTFLLLIFFMVTAVFSSQKSFHIPTPKEERATTVTTLEDYQDDPEFVVVRIDENSTFYISAPGWDDEREAPSEQDLRVGLSDARVVDSNGTIPGRLLVVAHGSAVHGRVVMVMDAGTDVGMEDIKLVTVEEDPT